MERYAILIGIHRHKLDEYKHLDASVWAVVPARTTQSDWRAVGEPFQEPLSNRAEGQWWSEREDVCHVD